MSTLEMGIGTADRPAVYIVDMRDEIITNAEQFMEALYRFRERHFDEIGMIRLSPTQEYCLRVDALKYVHNVKENRPYTLEELGPLKQFMGYQVVVNAEEGSMTKEEAIQTVKDMCERHKQSQRRYPGILQVGDGVWQALVAPGYIFPPGQEVSVAIPLIKVGGRFLSEEVSPFESIPVVKVVPMVSEQKHDGKLGGSGYEEATVEYYNAQYRPEGTAIYISGGYGDIESSSITLDPKQALSLLAWLTQEKATLDQLAKEQVG